jgi:hypothetical protein
MEFPPAAVSATFPAQGPSQCHRRVPETPPQSLGTPCPPCTDLR